MTDSIQNWIDSLPKILVESQYQECGGILSKRQSDRLINKLMYGVSLLTEQGSPYIRRENLQSHSNKPCSLPKVTLENVYVVKHLKDV